MDRPRNTTASSVTLSREARVPTALWWEGLTGVLGGGVNRYDGGRVNRVMGEGLTGMLGGGVNRYDGGKG